MPRIRYLRLIYDHPLMPYELKYFRASVIERTERKSDLFHNHKSDTEVIYRYPLIQYKIIRRKPAIICLNEGTDDIHYLLGIREQSFNINGDKRTCGIDEIKLQYVNMQTWDRTFRYNILNYMPYNQDNYALFKKLGNEKSRFRFLEELLKKHLQIIVDDLQLSCPQGLRVKIESLQSEKFIQYKGQYHQTYCLNIRSNLYMPNYIGIGKGSVLGFGVLKQINTSNGER